MGPRSGSALQGAGGAHGLRRFNTRFLLGMGLCVWTVCMIMASGITSVDYGRAHEESGMHGQEHLVKQPIKSPIYVHAHYMPVRGTGTASAGSSCLLCSSHVLFRLGPEGSTAPIRRARLVALNVARASCIVRYCELAHNCDLPLHQNVQCVSNHLH